uniref:Uncharacterized protein n=1 Tax=Arundo donax TaxID=35708 RepID=A0A0A9C244_ARUDO
MQKFLRVSLGSKTKWECLEP